MTIKELLADTTKFPDTLEIPISEGFKVSLKDLRESSKLAAAAEAAAQKRQEEADQQALRAANLLQELDRRASATPATPDATPESPTATLTWEQLEADPLLGLLAKRISSLDHSLASDLKTELASMKQSLNSATTRYLRRELEQDFSTIPDRFDDITLPTVIKHAVDNRMLDDMGIPRIHAAYDDLTRDRQFERREKAAYDRGRQEGHSLSQSEGMTLRPGFDNRRQATPGAQVHKDESGHPSLDAAAEAIRNDQDLMRQLAESLSTGAIQ